MNLREDLRVNMFSPVEGFAGTSLGAAFDS